ncbi:OmpA family protein [Halomonas halocynthiae]|uniref:OmpA family protein n=1 Tax=Halomonas halocynthiae TaxID=176290 RepID=UPI0003FA1642|nr:OmpA family protein [Halomonas halocynthiae]
MMIFNKRVLLAGLVAASAALVQGCVTSYSENADGVNFPDIPHSYIEEGTFVDPEAVLRISRGQTKDQVRALLADPHFDEGLFGNREWNYIFNFYTDTVPEGYMTCQYQVGFNSEVLVERTHWKNPACADLLVPVEVEEIADDKVVTLSADVLFDFDSDVLRLEGRRSIDRFADVLTAEFKNPRLQVFGFTDRLGDDAYNLKLSDRRAAAVKQALIENGVSAYSIQAVGKGESNPVASCPGVSGNALKECLQPNRRVEILITEAP